MDLARIAGLDPAGVICEIMNDDGTMARVPELTKFARKHGLLVITIADLIQYRMRTERLVKRARRPVSQPSSARFISSPTKTRSTTRRTWRWSVATSATARTCWCACTRSASPATCSTRRVATRGPQLDAALTRIAAEGRGVLLYLNQEGAASAW